MPSSKQKKSKKNKKEVVVVAKNDVDDSAPDSGFYNIWENKAFYLPQLLLNLMSKLER
ncbi:hypothetical protein SLEP1_g13002 [Rubroshorea leprosula]|uniref:Uncharacterized protein n=1 Tax=Rubroshorea leprosula TaxID=152421 RepID=A0AAV5IK97_9ROSI|nr:hypothetical protein SLEP1_g13002 [Rubroshorea leprosula]